MNRAHRYYEVRLLLDDDEQIAYTALYQDYVAHARSTAQFEAARIGFREFLGLLLRQGAVSLVPAA